MQCHVRSHDPRRMPLPARNRGTHTGCETPVPMFACRAQAIPSVASTGQHFPSRTEATRFAVPRDRAGCMGPWAFRQLLHAVAPLSGRCVPVPSTCRQGRGTVTWRSRLWLQTDAVAQRPRTRARELPRTALTGGGGSGRSWSFVPCWQLGGLGTCMAGLLHVGQHSRAEGCKRSVRALYSPPRTTSTGTGAVRMTCSAPLPSNTRPRPLRPWVPTTIRSAFHSRA